MTHTHTKTPTKAAEFIIAHIRRFELGILSLQQNIAIKAQQLFSEELFYRVQDVLDSKARTYRPKIKTIENFSLRGFFFVQSAVRS